MGNLVDYAREEMKRAGLYDADSDYAGEIPQAVLALVAEHEKQDHSGGSSGLTLAIFNKVVRFQPLTPISSDPSEWMEVGVDNRGTAYQNRRRPTVFSYDAGKTWYDIDKPLRFRRLRRFLGLKEFGV